MILLLFIWIFLPFVLTCLAFIAVLLSAAWLKDKSEEADSKNKR